MRAACASSALRSQSLLLARSTVALMVSKAVLLWSRLILAFLHFRINDATVVNAKPGVPASKE